MIWVISFTLIKSSTFEVIVGKFSIPFSMISVTIINDELIVLTSSIVAETDDVYWVVSVTLMLLSKFVPNCGAVNKVFCTTALATALAYSIPATVSTTCSEVVAFDGNLK